jgi:hypothetical protein
MWRWGAGVFAGIVLGMSIQSVSWMIRQEPVTASRSWSIRFMVWLGWFFSTAWCVRQEPSFLGWLGILGALSATTVFQLVATFQEVRRGSVLEAACALGLVFLAPMGWAFIFFYWPYLDGAGFFMGLVLPFSTAHFRDAMQAFAIGLGGIGVMMTIGAIRSRRPPLKSYQQNDARHDAKNA